MDCILSSIALRCKVCRLLGAVPVDMHASVLLTESMPDVALDTPRLVVRQPEVTDAPAVVDFLVRNREFLAPYEPTRPAEFYSLDWWEEQIRLDLEAFRQDRGLRLALLPRGQSSRVIGTVGLSNFARGAFQACHLGFSLDREFQGQGLMREALEAVLGLAFGRLGFHRLMANHLPDNQRSERLLVRLGFQCEGYARDYLRIDGRWRDHVLRSLVQAAPPAATDGMS